jgi:hypothetical protein
VILFRARLDQITNQLAHLAIRRLFDGEIAPVYSDKGRLASCRDFKIGPAPRVTVRGAAQEFTFRPRIFPPIGCGEISLNPISLPNSGYLLPNRPRRPDDVILWPLKHRGYRAATKSSPS